MKKISGMLIIFILSTFYSLSVSADMPVRFICSSIECTSGEQAEVTVRISDNSGIASLTIGLEWNPDILSLAEPKTVMGDNFKTGMTAENKSIDGKYYFSWCDTKNQVNDGNVITLNFICNSDASSGKYDINLNISGLKDENGEVVDYTAANGIVTVNNKSDNDSTDSNKNNDKNDDTHQGSSTGGRGNSLKDKDAPDNTFSDNTDNTVADINSQEQNQPSDNGFSDIKESDYFYNAVIWAAKRGISTGVSDRLFAPYDKCDRAQAATFIWRLEGEPKANSSSNPFNDINSDEYYYNAVLWGCDNNIINGVTKTEFSPFNPVTRAQFVTLLWRLNGCPNLDKSNEHNMFDDVSPNDYFYEPTYWAAEQGITNGTADGIFSPNDVCTRAQIITFLYRYNNL